MKLDETTAKKWAGMWFDSTLAGGVSIEDYTWRFERVFLRDLEGMRYGSIELVPFHTFSREDWKSWFEGELERSDPPSRWKGLLDGWVPEEPEEMVITFQPYQDGNTFMTIWEGHHRFAAASIRGLESLVLVVGRAKERKG